MTFSELREEVHWANCALPASGLVTMHSGNASGIHRESSIILIKPSAVDYATLRAAFMVEDLAKTLLLSRIIGPTPALPASEISKWWDRYHSSYGQTSG